MSRQLRLVVHEAEHGFSTLLKSILACDPQGSRIVQTFYRQINDRPVAASCADAVVIEVTQNHPLDLRWHTASPQLRTLPILICTQCALLVPPDLEGAEVLVMPFTVDELLTALDHLTQPLPERVE